MLKINEFKQNQRCGVLSILVRNRQELDILTQKMATGVFYEIESTVYSSETIIMLVEETCEWGSRIRASKKGCFLMHKYSFATLWHNLQTFGLVYVHVSLGIMSCIFIKPLWSPYR